MLQLRHDNIGQIREHSLLGHVLIQAFQTSCLLFKLVGVDMISIVFVCHTSNKHPHAVKLLGSACSEFRSFLCRLLSQ